MGKLTTYTPEENEIIYRCARAGMLPTAVERELAGHGCRRDRRAIANSQSYIDGSNALRDHTLSITPAGSIPSRVMKVPNVALTSMDAISYVPVSVAAFSWDEAA